MIEEWATAAFVALELHCRSDNDDVSAKGDLLYTAKLSRGETFVVGIEKDRSWENIRDSSISQ